MQDSTTVMKQLKPGPTKRKFTKESANAIAFAELVWQLHQGEYTREELIELTGIADSTLRKWMKYLRNPKRRMVYICERRRTSKTGACKLVYAWGPGEKDIPVIRKTDAEYSRTYRMNKQLKGIENALRP